MRALCLLGAVWVSAACGRGSGGDGPMPAPGFGVLGGQRVLVLPVHYVQPVDEGWVGGAASADQALRQANAEIAFALREQKSTTQWVVAGEIAAAVERQPAMGVHIYGLSADPVRRSALGRADRVRDPLYGEIRRLAALMDARYAVFPVELWYEPGPTGYGAEGRAALWTVLLDVRTGFVLWSGMVRGSPGPAGSEATVARAAEALARQVTP